MMQSAYRRSHAPPLHRRPLLMWSHLCRLLVLRPCLRLPVLRFNSRCHTLLGLIRCLMRRVDCLLYEIFAISRRSLRLDRLPFCHSSLKGRKPQSASRSARRKRIARSLSFPRHRVPKGRARRR